MFTNANPLTENAQSHCYHEYVELWDEQHEYESLQEEAVVP